MFFACSINFCGAAFDLAKEITAKVKILNVIPYVQPPPHIPFVSGLKDPGDETLLDKARKKMLNPCYNLNYKLINEENIIESVLNFVSEEKVLLLSLNTQRRNLFGRVFMPCVSRRILSKSDTVLLVLRGKRLRDSTRL